MKHVFRVELVELSNDRAEIRILIKGDPQALGMGIASVLIEKDNDTLEELMEAVVTHHLKDIIGAKQNKEDIRLKTEGTKPN